jgi:hypothetical protein
MNICNSMIKSNFMDTSNSRDTSNILTGNDRDTVQGETLTTKRDLINSGARLARGLQQGRDAYNRVTSSTMVKLTKKNSRSVHQQQ